jgi:hypothetical protein
MSHVRTQLRQAAAAALASVAPVLVSRVYPVSAEDQLPVLLVYTNAEDIEGHTMGAFKRTVELVVEAVAKGPFVDDDLDTLAVGIEGALNRSTLGNLTRPLVPVTISVGMDTAATTIGRLRITYRAVYHTGFTAPEVAV